MSTENTIDIDRAAQNLNAAIAATEIRFNIEPSEILERFKGTERTIEFDENGQPFSVYDSQSLPLAECLQRWAADAPDGTCDRRTLPRSPGGGRKGVASKQDLQTPKDKAAYISEFGYDSFAALPTKAQPTEELKYREQYYALPTSEKSRLAAKFGPDFVRTLPARPSDQPHGGYVNHAALEKQKQIRGKSAR